VLTFQVVGVVLRKRLQLLAVLHLSSGLQQYVRNSDVTDYK